MSRSIRRTATLLLALSLLASAAMPALALAATAPKINIAPSSSASGSGSFGPLPQTEPTPTETTATTSTTSSTSGSLGGGVVILMAVGGVALIGGIGWLIMRDARANAPTRRGERHGPSKTQTPRADRVQRSRARAKAARQARKRTR